MFGVTALLVVLCVALDCGVGFHFNVKAPYRSRRTNELQVSCNASQFKCLDGRRCITRTQLCNRKNDCIDGSDESNCPFALIARKRGVFDDVSPESNGFFICKDTGRKINQWMVCDGDNDCEDASDEFDCKDLSRCDNNEVECSDGSRCLLKAWLCDGRKDCEDGSDEAKCDLIVCAPHQFLCPKTHTCIPRAFVCDEHPDCPVDAADEKDCSWATAPEDHKNCTAEQFSCHDGTCLPLEKVCDKIVHCSNGADEQNCIKNSCASDACVAPKVCIPVPGGHFCACQPGSTLEQDDCKDIDECAMGTHGCSHQCVNTYGSFRCACAANYILEADGKGCIASEGSPLLFFTEGSTVFALDVRENVFTAVAQHLSHPVGVAYDPSNGHVLWTEVTPPRIAGAVFPPIDDVSLARPITIISNGLKNPEGIAIDWLNDLLYYTDSEAKAIYACTLNGDKCTIVLRSSGKLRGIALYPEFGLMFFTDWNENKPSVESAGMDGSQRRSIITTDIRWPNSVAIDKAQNALYWVDGGLDKIERCDLDGNNRKVVIDGVRQPFAIAVFENRMYWSDWATNAIESADKLSGKRHKELFKARATPSGISLYHPLMVNASVVNPCRRAKCTHMCLLSPVKPKFRCICPEGLKLARDGFSCTNNDEGCPMGKFSCADGLECVPTTWVCDGNPDCTDGSDESHKTCFARRDATTSLPIFKHEVSQLQECNSNEFRCHTKECISRLLLCDGHNDCQDGSDEHSWCGSCTIDNGGCSHDCRNTPDGPACSCPLGLEMMDDGHSCADVDECKKESTNRCDHYCFNTQGSYDCGCADGYDLEADGRTCRLLNKTGLLFFSLGHQILDVPLVNSLSKPANVMMESRAGKIVGLDYSIRSNRLYYTDHDEGYIYAHNSDNICLIEGLYYPQNVAIDWVTDNIYFTNDRPGVVGLCTPDGRFCKKLIFDGVLRPRGLAVHPRRGLLFWTDWGDLPRIESSYLDGTNRRAIAVDKLVWPNSLAIDYVHDHLYWIDAQLKLIERCDLDGGNRKVVLSKGLQHPFDLIVFDHRIFWTDWKSNNIFMVDMRNISTSKATLHHASTPPYCLAINSGTYQQLDIPNPCLIAGCSHMCALQPDGVASCLCPDGYDQVDDTGKRCYQLQREKRHMDYEDELVEYAPHLCTSTWLESCASGICMNGGECLSAENEKMACKCLPGFTGVFCEISSHQISATSQSASQASSGKGWLVGLFVVVVLCLCLIGGVVYVYRRSAFYNVVLRNGRLGSFPPSILFHRRVAPLDQEYKQKIIDHEVGSSPDCSKVESFGNPIYEETFQRQNSDFRDHEPLLHRLNSGNNSPTLFTKTLLDLDTAADDGDSAIYCATSGSTNSLQDLANAHQQPGFSNPLYQSRY